MSKQKTDTEIIAHKDAAISSLNEYLSNLIESKNPDSKSKADKICYWLETYSQFLDYESDFNPKKRCKYKRGQIVKADFGFRIGSEYGGLHYAIVIDVDNSIHSPVVTVIPLTSVKANFSEDKLKRGQVYLGDEIYNKLNNKANEMSAHLSSQKHITVNSIKEIESNTNLTDETINTALKSFEKVLEPLEQEVSLLDKVKKEIKRMKHGSIAITNQITTISKIRISDPKTSGNVLSGIKISSEMLDKLDKALSDQFLNKNKKK
jgi:hypothetical protein